MRCVTHKSYNKQAKYVTERKNQLKGENVAARTQPILLLTYVLHIHKCEKGFSNSNTCEICDFNTYVKHLTYMISHWGHNSIFDASRS